MAKKPAKRTFLSDTSVSYNKRVKPHTKKLMKAFLKSDLGAIFKELFLASLFGAIFVLEATVFAFYHSIKNK